ncbi:MAG: GTP-binding protein [Nitrospirae bacterium]|nr:GTP-binding protein [Nitrospirota bacterium]
MKITIVCGLLGSGKTTFIRNIAKGSTQKTVVLVNDFGKAGIDGEVFSASGIDSVELPSGCICCTLRFDLITSIKKIMAEYNPDHLIIEPSGIASPSGVIEALGEMGLRQYSIIGIVDSTEFVELYEAEVYSGFFEEQVSLSDIVLINKIDLIDEDLANKTAALVNTINPGAIVYRTVRAALDEPLPEGPEERTGNKTKGKRLNFETLSLTLTGSISARSVEDFFRELAGGRFGNIIRGKGLLNTDIGPQKFDLTFGNMESAVFNNRVTESRIVIIGYNLDMALIMKAANDRWETLIL